MRMPVLRWPVGVDTTTYIFGLVEKGTDSAIAARNMASCDYSSSGLAVKLDGHPVSLPSDRRSFNAIRSYLESLALQQQRILCWLSIDGEPVGLTQQHPPIDDFSRVEAETMSLNDVPLQLIKGALQQTLTVRAKIQTAIELVLINDAENGKELWWTVATMLKEPLLTLSLLPDDICGPDNGRASLIQLRKWQLEQLGRVIQDVDEACRFDDPTILTEALEQRAVPWLDKLQESLEMWQETISSRPAPLACPGE